MEEVNIMGTVYTEITLKNATDVGDALRRYIGEDEVRSLTVNAVVDTGASTIVINEEIREKLGLEKLDERRYKLADGRSVPGWRTDPVDIRWKDRRSACHAVVIPNADTVLLGAIPLEDMDLMVHPKTQEVVGIHGEEQLIMIY